MDKLIAEYIIDFNRFLIYACFENEEAMENNDIDFFDIYFQRGPEQICVNEGAPFFPDDCEDKNCPTYSEVADFVREFVM